MTPKEKAIETLWKNRGGQKVNFGLDAINKAIDVALKEQTEQIFDDLKARMAYFKEDSMMHFHRATFIEIKRKWLNKDKNDSKVSV